MRVGVLTSWRVPCGVYQYSARLAEALARRPDTDPVILAGRADEHRSVPEESSMEVHDTGQIGLWRDDGQYSLDVDTIFGLELDVVHVQYQSMLVREPDLQRLREGFRGVYAVTFHDNCLAPSFPVDVFDLRFTHRHGVGVGAETIPFGIEDRAPVVRTFGLGRTRSDLVAPVCERNGWVFEDAASHEPIHGGGQQWRTHEDLVAWLRGADVVVLWYDDNAAAGSSQAVRTAMAARRQVFSNDTSWFGDLPGNTRGYAKVHDLEHLEKRLVEHFRRGYVESNSWDHVAQRLVYDYKTVAAAKGIEIGA